ncbi:S8 family serine peptidase [Pelotomaculum sp. PtaB.Bin117]|uniref:S8 family serine peptidase n=1 Tax=Pelotomaculum sp. PtaB.Bin117 TaxID=1811694 RepID=UPI0009C95F10|nr:S8 family serine peptidase [Pelotomaculum sp. PtaB.Bin117]OPX91274.1 MAG: Serine protease AprX [Pelotomaculum sp. PtaB.Bin117]
MRCSILSRKGLTGLSVIRACLTFVFLLILTLLLPYENLLDFSSLLKDSKIHGVIGTKYTVSFLNDRAGDITGAAAVNAPGFVVPGGLTGEGQIVAIADSGLDTGNINNLHPDLQSTPGKMPKVVLLKSWAGRDVPDDPNGHGTHMAATVAGTGAASNGKFRGVAPGASIYFQGILNKDGEPEIPANLADLFWPAYSAGARVHVDGWGGGPDVYQESAAQIDDFIRSYPDFLAIFGAGNSGPSAGTLTTEANSKNALTVGASVLPRPAFVPGADNTTATADFSSRGPTGDGRIKPDLLAPASAVISARSRLVEGNLPGYPEYTRMQGTSMATAVAGGSATILLEYFKKYMNITAPSAAMVKGTLINGSRPTTDGPSLAGFGVIDLTGTIIALKEGSFKVADELTGVSQGNEMSYTFHVSDAASPFKATLTWTDPPAEPGSAQALVNDLDLLVRTPDGRVYYGNCFLGSNSPDRINNVEQVCLPSPLPGDYTVQVIGAGVRRNTVSGSAVISQDYALTWGQAPAEGMVENTDGRSIELADGASFSTADLPLINLVNDNIAPVDAGHLFPGAEVYRTSRRVYLAARLWRATGVKALKTAGGTVFTEISPSARMGGYSLAGDAGGIVLNNNRTVAPSELPPGVEVNAVINPVDQQIRQVSAAYIERVGVVSAMRNVGGQKEIILMGNGGSYRLSDDAACSFEDSYKVVETADMLFGTGALDELEEALPGMPVRLRLAPSTGEVQYLAVKRTVALGTVHETVASSGEIKMDNGATIRAFPGAPVKRDRKDSSIDEIKPGDHVTAAILPDTGEAIGMVVYSSVLYGRIIDFTKKDREFYLLDTNGCYRSFSLTPDTVIYRWGVRTQDEAIASGRLVRVTTDPSGKEVWQLDIGENFYSKEIFKKYNEAEGVIITGGGEQYRSSGITRFYKNGYPVLPGDLFPGEQVELEYATAPLPTGHVLVSVNARSTVSPPSLFVSGIPLQGCLAVTGRAGANTIVEMWGKEGFKQTISLDESGRFTYFLKKDYKVENNFTLVAVDRRTGGVCGRKINLSDSASSGGNDIDVSRIVEGVLVRVMADTAPGSDMRSFSEVSLTRVEAVAIIARLLQWPDTNEWPPPFSDMEDIPVKYRPIVAEARARGIINGYPDGSFQPTGELGRADAAVVFASVLRDLGIEINSYPELSYADAGIIPAWASKAVAGTTAAGLFHGNPGGSFVPGGTVTAGEMTILLERFLYICERYLAGIITL